MKRLVSRPSRPFAQILLIEQDQDAIAAISTLLSKIPESQLRVSTSFADALLVTLEKRPALILFTHGLPGRNSLEVFASIRNKYPSIYLIVILRAANQDLIEEYENAGAAECIIKDANFLTTLDAAVKLAFIQISAASVGRKAKIESAEQSPSLGEVISMFSALEPGEQILHYRIIDAIGKGGMGEVYKAQDLKLGRIVAIKALPLAISENDEARRRFLREAQSASRLNHPGIVTIHAIEEVEDFQFIVMEYVEGQSLRAVLEKDPLPLNRLILIGSQIAEALGTAHSARLIHRDIKPANIMITPQDKVKILDFGLAKPISLFEISQAEPVSEMQPEPEELTSGGAVLGTVHYMSPEQTRGETLDARTDIFSLGCVLYEAATSKRPFRGANILAVMHEIATSDPPLPSNIQAGLPKEFDDIIAKCLAKDRTLRTLSAQQLADDLKKISLLVPSEQRKERQRQRLLLPLSAVVVMIFLLIAGFRYWANREPHASHEKIFITVIPFENQTGRAELNYVRHGLSSELALLMSQEPEFIFVPFSDMQRLLQKGVTQTEAARKAHADYLVEGALRNTDSGMVLSYSLKQVKSKTQFTDSFPLSTSDFLGGLNHIQSQLLSWLKLRSAESPLTMNPRAFELYLDGFSKIREMEAGREKSFGEAKALLQSALDIEPSAEIYHGLAYLYYQAINLGIDFSPENLELCRDYLNRGLAMRPDYVPLIDVNTRYEFYMGRPERTLHIAADQIKANRLSVELIGMIGMSFRHSGDYPMSERFFRYALQLSPENYYIKLIYAACLFQSGKRQLAVNELEKLDAENPERYWGKYYLAWYNLLLGRIDEGRKLTEKLPDTLPTRILKYQAGLSPDGSNGFEPTQKMLEAAEVDFHFSFRLAQCYSLSGKTDKALHYLQKTTRKGWIAWNYFDWDPMLANLRATKDYNVMRSEGLILQKSTVERERKLVQPAILKLDLQ